jgi:hypothetical protein
MRTIPSFKPSLSIRPEYLVRSLGLILLSSFLAYIWVLVHYIHPAPFHLFKDPELAYMMDSLSLFKGKLYEFYQHPGTPVEILGSFLLILTYPFLSQNFVSHHLQHPETFMILARGVLTIGHIVGCVLLARHAIRINHWTDALFSIAIPASFYALSAWLGFRGVILWDHNSFTLPAGSVLLLAVLVTFRSGQQVRSQRIMALGFGMGVLTATQLYFITWVVGLIVTITCFHLLHRHSWTQAIQSTVFAGLAAIFGFVVVTLPIINHYGNLFGWIKRLIFHQGTYGLGEPGIFSPQVVWINLIQMWNHSPAFCIAIPLILLILGLTAFLQFPNSSDNRNRGLWAVTCGLSIQLVVTLIIILKHYGDHYLLAIAAIVPLLLAVAHTLFSGSSVRPSRICYAIISMAVFTGFILNLKHFTTAYANRFQASRLAQEKAENFFKEYAAAIGKDKKSLKVVWSINTDSPCFARWHNSREYRGVFDKEISRICPSDFYLLLYSPYIYLDGQHILLEDFDWDVLVVAQEFLPQWTYLIDYGHVSSRGDLLFFANWKQLDNLTKEVAEAPFQGYNIFSVGRRFFFGVSQHEGGLSFERLRRSDYRNLIEGSALNEVQGRIAGLSAPSEQVQKPILITEWYRGYRIVRMRDRFYGIPYGDVQFDLERFWARDHANGVEATTLEKVKDGIDALWRPEVVVQGHRGYDIYQAGQSFYGIRQSDGEFDLKRFHMGKYRDYVNAFSIGETKKRIDALVPKAPIECGRRHSAGFD